jgi:hypothetical protein
VHRRAFGDFRVAEPLEEGQRHAALLLGAHDSKGLLDERLVLQLLQHLLGDALFLGIRRDQRIQMRPTALVRACPATAQTIDGPAVGQA